MGAWEGAIETCRKGRKQPCATLGAWWGPHPLLLCLVKLHVLATLDRSESIKMGKECRD